MKTYYLLLQKIAGCETIVYPPNNDTIYSFAEQTKFFNNLTKKSKIGTTTSRLLFFMNELARTKSKHEFIEKKHKKMYDYKDNKFCNYENMINILVKAQKYYNAFSKLANIFRYTRKPKITTDLMLCEINKNKMLIYHENALYAFTFSDLINCINKSLHNCSHFYADPRPIRNPYNNLPFSKSNLYNVYFELKKTDYKFSILLHQYFLCEFNINKFKIENEYLIRDAHIKNIVYTTNSDSLYKSMKYMIEHTNKHMKIQKNIDKEKFIKIMRPYYYLYLVTNYHVSGLDKTQYSLQVFRKKIFELYEYNCKFGRVYYKRQPITNVFIYISDLDHPLFTMNDAMHLSSVKHELFFTMEGLSINNDDSEDSDDLPELLTDDSDDDV